MENDLNQGLEYLNLHQKWPHDGPDEVHEVHGLIETDKALGGVFVRSILPPFLYPPFLFKKCSNKNCIAFLDPPENE